MDVDGAIGELSAFIDLSTLVKPAPTPGVTFFGFDRYPRGVADALIASAHVVEQILDRIPAGWRSTGPPDKHHRWGQTREACTRAVAQLQREQEIRQKLGDGSPSVSMSGLHPWVWDVTRTFWAQGACRVAVREAASSLNAHTQAKVGRYDVVDDALLGEVFSASAPSPRKPRLRLANPDSSMTQDSRQRGARDLAQGCFWALRNPAIQPLTSNERVSCRAPAAARRRRVSPPAHPTRCNR